MSIAGIWINARHSKVRGWRSSHLAEKQRRLHAEREVEQQTAAREKKRAAKASKIIYGKETNLTGKIRSIFGDRGFGFIMSDDGQEYFFHARGVKDRRFNALNLGEALTFDIEKGPKGLMAVNVTALHRLTELNSEVA